MLLLMWGGGARGGGGDREREKVRMLKYIHQPPYCLPYKYSENRLMFPNCFLLKLVTTRRERGGGGGGEGGLMFLQGLAMQIALPACASAWDMCVVFKKYFPVLRPYPPPPPPQPPQDFCATVQRTALHKIWGLLINSFPRIEVPYCKHKAPSTDIFYGELEPLKRRI